MATSVPTQFLITETFSELVDDFNTVSLDLGATGRLNTNQDSDVVGSINELELAIRGASNNLVAADLATGGLTATDLTAAIVELDSDIGARPHTTLTTTAKTLTGAVNELDSDVGNRASLTTTDATNLVAAINEINTSITIDSDGRNNHLDTAGVFQSLRLIDSALGNMIFRATFVDSDKTDLTTAINGLRDDLDLLDSDNTSLDGRLGSLSSLDSAFVGSERDSFVNAINALRADIPLIYDETGTQLN